VLSRWLLLKVKRTSLYEHCLVRIFKLGAKKDAQVELSTAFRFRPHRHTHPVLFEQRQEIVLVDFSDATFSR